MEEKDNNISNGSGTDWQKVLNDFNKTYANHQDASDEKLFSAFPEFGGDSAKLKAAKDYYTTTAKHSDVPLEQINAKFPEFFGSADAVAETPKSPVIDGKKYSPYVESFRQRMTQKTDAKGNPVSAVNSHDDNTEFDIRTGNPIITPNTSRLYEESEDYVADPLEKQRDTERLEKMLLEKDAPERDFNGNVRKSPKVKYKGEERANIQAQIEKNNADIEKYNNYVNNAVLSAGAPKQYENAEQVYEYARKAYDNMKSGAEKKRRNDDEMSELYAEMMDKVAKGEIDLGVDYAGYLQHIEKANELGKEYSRLSSIDAESLDEAGKKAYAKEAQRYNAETKAFGEEGKKYGDDFVKSLNEKVGEAFDAYYNQNKAKTVDENGNEVGLYEYEYMKGFDAAMGRYINENTMPFKIEKVKENHESIEKRIAEYNKANPSQLIGISPSTGVAVYSHGPEEDKITQAVSLQHESEGMIKAYNKGGMEQLARGFGNKITDFDIYTLGITDAIGNDRLNKISKKIDAAGDFDKGYESLTEAEKILWDSYMENGLVMEYLSSGINAGYRAGQTTAEMIPFMVQMALTEGIAVNSRIGQWAMKKGLYSAAEKGGARALQSAAAEAAAKKTFGAAVKDFAVKGLKEGTIKGAIGASTIGAGNVAANATERMLGTAVVDIDPIDGKVSYRGQAGQEKDWKAWTLAYLGQTLEMQSEMTGEYITGMFKPLASGVFGGMVKDGNKFFSKMFNALKSNKYANALGNIRRATFTGGFLEEFSEEMWRNLEGAIIGETEWSSFSKENLLETAYGLLPAQILFGGVNMGGAVKHTVRAAKARKALGNKNPELVERYDKVMNAGTYAAQDFISSELSLIMNGKGEYAKMDDAQKAASVEYLLSMQEKTYMDEYAALEGDKAKKDYLHEMTRRVNLNNGGVSFVEVTDDNGNTMLQGTLESTDGDKSVVMDYSGKRHEVSTNSVKTVQTYTESEIEQNAKDIAEQAGIDMTLYDVSGLFSGDTAMNDGESVLVGGLTATVESVDENGNYTVRYENADGEAVRTMTHSERELREILTQGVEEEAELQGDIEGIEINNARMTSEDVNAFGEDEETSLQIEYGAMNLGRMARRVESEMRKQFSDEEIAAFDAMDARQKARYILSLDDSRKAKAAWNYVDSNYGSIGDAIGRRKQRAFDDAVRRLKDYGINGTAETATYNGNTVVVKGSTGTMAVVDDLMGNTMTVDASELQDNKPMTVKELATMITADEANALDLLGEMYNGTFFALGETVGIGVDENGKMIDGVVTGVDADGNVTYTVGKEQFTESKTALRDKKEAAEAQYAEMQQRRVEEERKKRLANGLGSGTIISIVKGGKKMNVKYDGKMGGKHTMYTLDGNDVIGMNDEEFNKAFIGIVNTEDTQAAQAQPEQAQEQQEQPKQQEQRQERPKPQRDEQAIMDMYNRLYQQFGVPVMLVNTPEKLAQLGQKDVLKVVSENKGKIRGWMSDGKIYIYLPYIESADEMAEVYLHEVIGHMGIRELMKKHKTDFDMLCDSVWDSMDEESRRRYVDYVHLSKPNKNGKALEREAADEYIAHIVQEMKDDVGARHVFGKIVDFIVEWLDRIGIKMGITRNQIEDLARDAMAMFEAEARGEQYVPQYQFGDSKIEEQIEEEEVANQIAEEEKAKEAQRQEKLKQEEVKNTLKRDKEGNIDIASINPDNAELYSKAVIEEADNAEAFAENGDADYIKRNLDAAKKAAEKAENRKPKSIKASSLRDELEEIESGKKSANKKLDFWKAVDAEMGRRKAEAEAQALQYQANENAAQAALDDLQQSLDDALVAKPSEMADGEPQSGKEFIAQYLRNGGKQTKGNIVINADSMMKEKGYKKEDLKGFVGLFNYRGGGVTIGELSNMIYESAKGQGYNFFADDHEARNEILDFFGDVRTVGDIMKYTNENRKAQVEEEIDYIQSRIESEAQAQGYESSQAMYDDIMEQGRNLVEMARDENGNIDTESLSALQELMEALKPKFGEEAVNEGSQQEVGEDGFDWYQQTDYVPFSIANTDSELIDNIIKDNGELDYEAINEVSRRVENDSWGIFRLPAEAARNNAGKEGIVARAIARASERFLGRMGKGQRLHNGDVARAIRVLAKGNIEKWAKHEGIWFTNSELEKSSDFRFRGKESDVYLKNGEQSVIKFTKPISFKDRTQLLLEQLDMFNSLFDDKYEVIGFGKDESGDLCAVVKQNFVVGERIADKYSDYDGIIDKFMKETYGLDKDVDENGFDIYKNDFFIVDDVHGYNVVVDSNGDLHVIDANVSLNTESGKVSYADDNVRFSLREMTQEEKDEVNKAALENFGTTRNWNEAGYVMKDGTMLDFSGRKEGASGGSRTIDHREVRKFFDDDFEYMWDGVAMFMNAGNIRVDVYGTISLSEKPSKEQLSKLDELIRRNDGEVNLEIYDKNGNSVCYAEYVNARPIRVKNDIVNYFDNGVVPTGNANDTRFSITPEMDSDFRKAYEEGDTEKAAELVKQAAKMAMPNTKVVDENGEPMVVYHGTDADFNVFEGGVYHFGTREQAELRLNDWKEYIESQLKDIREKKRSAQSITETRILSEQEEKYLAKLEGLKNPKIGSFFLNIKNLERTEDENRWREKSENAKQYGVDGFVYYNVYENDGNDSYAVFNSSQIKSADPFTFDDNGELIPLSERFNAENDDIRFSTIPLPDPTSEEAYEPDALTERFSVALGSNPASIDYDKEVSSKFFTMYSALLDGAIALKRMQSAVARGTEIGEFENPYLMEIARVSRTAAENKRLEPLAEELKSAITAFLRMRGARNAEWYDQDMRRLSTYAICKHGLERNQYFYERALAKREEENQAAYEKYESRFEKSAKEYEESLQEEYAIYSRYNKTPRMSYDEWLKAKHDASYKGYLSWMKANKPNETPLGYDEYIEGRNERARDLRIEYNAYLKYDKQQPMTYDEWLAAKWNRSYRGYLAWMKANRPGEDVLELDEYKDLKTPKKLTYDEFAAKRNARLGEVIPEDNAGLTAIAEEIDPSVNRKHEKATDEINEKINNINADIEILKGQIENETDEDEIDRMEAELEQLKADRKALNKQLADEKKSYYNELMAISNSEVLAYENEFGTDKTDRLWNAINAISAEIRDHWREGGIVSKEAYDEMQRRFKYYIPLRGFDEKTTADEYAYQSTPSVQQRFEGFKKMEGRTSRAADPFSTILRMLDSAVDAHYKNDVGKAVFNLALNHKDNGLLYTAKVWEVADGVDENGKTKWVASEPQGITQGMSGTQIERIIKNHESEMKALAKRGAARPIQYINGKKLPKDAEQHHRLKVMIDGKPVYVFIAGDTKAFDALNRPDYSNKVSKYTGAFTRFMSRFMTTYKPSFIIRNAMRDFGMANFIMYSQGGFGYMRDFDKNWRTLVHKGNIRKLTKGTCEEYVELNGQQVRLQDLFDEFYTNGGETGYTRTLSQEAKHKELETELRRATRRGGNKAKDLPMIGIRYIGERMEDLNRYAEDLARFSIYVTARQNGKSITDAVADAKNGTANFSKKGDSAFAAFMNRNFAFFNASLQGFNTFAHSFKGEGKWRAVGATASLAAMGVMLPIVNVLLLAFNGDDDDWATYENLSQYVTNTNFTLFIPGLHKFITVPYPQELVPVMALGNIVARNTMGMTSPADDDTIFGNITMQWISTVADLMPVNPLETALENSKGYNDAGDWIRAIARPLAPTYISPVTDVLLNRNFMGGEVRHKHYTQYNERDDKPYWAEADPSKAPMATFAARIIAGNDPYEASTVFWNLDPKQIDHIVQGYTNGVGAIIGDFSKAFTAIGNGTFDFNSVPAVKKFIISPTPMKWDGQVTSKLYDIADEIDRTKKERKKIEKRIDKALNDGKDASKYLEELRELDNSLPYRLYNTLGDLNKTMKDIKERKANIMADETDTNEERNAKLEELSKEKMFYLDIASEEAEKWRSENGKSEFPSKIRKAIYELKKEE